MSKGGLVLDTKRNEMFQLRDAETGTITTIKIFYRDSGSLAVRFEAPKNILISRKKE